MSLSHNTSALGAFYRGMCVRMEEPRTNTTVAHTLARMTYVMLARGESYVDQGQQRYEHQRRERSRRPQAPSRCRAITGLRLLVSQEAPLLGSLIVS